MVAIVGMANIVFCIKLAEKWSVYRERQENERANFVSLSNNSILSCLNDLRLQRILSDFSGIAGFIRFEMLDLYFRWSSYEKS